MAAALTAVNALQVFLFGIGWPVLDRTYLAGMAFRPTGTRALEIDVDDDDAFLAEMVRLLALLPQRGLDAAGLDFSDCYFRQSDLRGIDFSQSNLKGASINACKISGVLFPAELSPSEIELSLLHGTRMRYRVP